MRIILALAAALGLAATPAIAADPPKKEKKICKRIDMGSTGSRLRSFSKTCLTASEWEEIDQAAQRTMQDSDDGRFTDPDRGPASMGAGPS